VTFTDLENRARELVYHRIRGGETTVRALARRIQLSQPHLHNVLHGHRHATPETWDRILTAAGIDAASIVCDCGEHRGRCVVK